MATPKGTALHTELLGGTVEVSENPPMGGVYADRAGEQGRIVNVYQDADREVRYTVLFEDGGVVEAYSAHAGNTYTLSLKNDVRAAVMEAVRDVRQNDGDVDDLVDALTTLGLIEDEEDD